MLCARIEQTPVHDDVPEAAIYSIDGCEDNEDRLVFRAVVEAVQTECHVIENGEGVFTAVDQMWKTVTCVFVATKTLKSTPDARKSREESQ